MKAPRTVAISTSSFASHSTEPLDKLRAAGFQARLNPQGRRLTANEAQDHIRDAVGLLAGTEPLSRDVLTSVSNLRVISRVGAGVDNVDRAAARELGIEVKSTPEAHIDAVAELTVAGLLAALRRIPEADRRVREGWAKPAGRLLRGKTVGIVGLGRVGRAVATLLGPFGAKLLATDTNEDFAAAEWLGVHYLDFDELLAKSDVVTLHLNHSQATHHLVGARELARMKHDAALVNTSRGGLIDEAALAAHLREHPEALAYIDCFEEEPYTGPLIELENAVLTPHVGTYARECRVRMELEAVDNLLSALAP